MRKRIGLILVLFSTLVLSGCTIFYEHSITVNPDHSANVDLKLTVDTGEVRTVENQLRAQGDAYVTVQGVQDNMDQRMQQFKDGGFTVNKISSANEYGFLASRKFSNISSLTGDKVGINEVGFFRPEDFLLEASGEEIKFKFTADLSGMEAKSNYGTAQALYAYYDLSDRSAAKVVLNLPSPAQRHNATFVSPDGTHLEWDLKWGENNVLYADTVYTLSLPEQPAEGIIEDVKGFFGNWESYITERDADGDLVAFENAEEQIRKQVFGFEHEEFQDYDTTFTKVKKMVYFAGVKWRLMITKGFAEIGSFLGGE